MGELRITFSTRRGWLGAIWVIAAAFSLIALIAAVSMLPGILFGTRLTEPEAEESIRNHLLSQAITTFYQRAPHGMPVDIAALNARYSTEVLEPLKNLEFVSVDVDTVIFGLFSIRRSFVVKVVLRRGDEKPSTHYFCFIETYVTGECAKWNWFLAW